MSEAVDRCLNTVSRDWTAKQIDELADSHTWLALRYADICDWTGSKHLSSGLDPSWAVAVRSLSSIFSCAGMPTPYVARLRGSATVK